MGKFWIFFQMILFLKHPMKKTVEPREVDPILKKSSIELYIFESFSLRFKKKIKRVFFCNFTSENPQNSAEYLSYFSLLSLF